MLRGCCFQQGRAGDMPRAWPGAGSCGKTGTPARQGGPPRRPGAPAALLRRVEGRVRNGPRRPSLPERPAQQGQRTEQTISGCPNKTRGTSPGCEVEGRLCSARACAPCVGPKSRLPCHAGLRTRFHQTSPRPGRHLPQVSGREGQARGREAPAGGALWSLPPRLLCDLGGSGFASLGPNALVCIRKVG